MPIWQLCPAPIICAFPKKLFFGCTLPRGARTEIHNRDRATLARASQCKLVYLARPGHLYSRSSVRNQKRPSLLLCVAARAYLNTLLLCLLLGCSMDLQPQRLRTWYLHGSHKGYSALLLFPLVSPTPTPQRQPAPGGDVIVSECVDV